MAILAASRHSYELFTASSLLEVQGGNKTRGVAFTTQKNDKDAYGKATNGSGYQQERCFASVWAIRTWRRACSGVCGYRWTALGDRATLRTFYVLNEPRQFFSRYAPPIHLKVFRSGPLV